jgi:hypothetical protein
MNEMGSSDGSDLAAAKVARLKRELVDARRPLKKIASEMEFAAKQLRFEPATLELDRFAWLLPDQIEVEIARIRSSESALARTQEEAGELDLDDDQNPGADQ